jgi:hypothetical protein
MAAFAQNGFELYIDGLRATTIEHTTPLGKGLPNRAAGRCRAAETATGIIRLA